MLNDIHSSIRSEIIEQGDQAVAPERQQKYCRTPELEVRFDLQTLSQVDDVPSPPCSTAAAGVRKTVPSLHDCLNLGNRHSIGRTLLSHVSLEAQPRFSYHTSQKLIVRFHLIRSQSHRHILTSTRHDCHHGMTPSPPSRHPISRDADLRLKFNKTMASFAAEDFHIFRVALSASRSSSNSGELHFVFDWGSFIPIYPDPEGLPDTSRQDFS